MIVADSDVGGVAATVPGVNWQAVGARWQVAALAVLGLLGLPGFTPYIGEGLDSSWVIAVSTATDRQIPFGKSLIFSYGPLGFIASPAFAVPTMGVVSVWVRIAFAVVVGWLIARSVLAIAPWWAAAIVTVGGVWVLGGAFALGAEAVLIPSILFVGGFLDVLATVKNPLRVRTVLFFGFCAGTSLLIKFDTGLWGYLFLVGGLVLHGRALRLGFSGLAQRIGAATVGFAGAVLLWWVVLSQPVGSLAVWIRGSVEVLLGYDRAMVTNAGQWWDLPTAIGACVVVGLLSWLLAPAGRRSYVCLFLGGASFLFTKQSFTRQDSGGHLVRIFALLLFSLLVLLGAKARSNTQQGPLVAVDGASSDPGTPERTSKFSGAKSEHVWSVSMVVAVLCATMILESTRTGDNRMAWPDTGMIPQAMSWFADPSQVEPLREQLLKNLKIGSELRKKLLQGSVHIEPSETSVVLGLPEMKWNPLPIPQSYSAYTNWLDQKNANALSSRNGPEQVLYESSSIDNRVSRFESPAAMVSLVCHYHQAYLDKRWTLFRRNVTDQPSGSSLRRENVAPVNACEGPTVELKALIGRFGQRVDLDIEGLDDYLIVGRFDGFEVTNQTRLQELLTRPAQFWFRIGDNRNGPYSRFVPATAGQQHILSMPACLRNKLGNFDTGLFTNFAVFDAPPRSKRATSKDRTRYRVRLEALPFKCPAAQVEAGN